jgi:hypothetical protein
MKNSHWTGTTLLCPMRAPANTARSSGMAIRIDAGLFE